MMTPHITVENDADGVQLTLKSASIVLPPGMAVELARLLLDAADAHDPLGVRSLPVVKPA